MLGIVKEINGQKTIIPLTTDAGTGAPVGTLIQQYKKKPMSGYLYCDGSTFDQNAYPALYMYLGSNVLPDYRECVMVGAEQNTTDTIATHDVYAEGEFKDDQLQRITGSFEVPNRNRAPEAWEAFSVSSSDKTWFAISGDIAMPSLVSFDSSKVARTGDTNTTHGKQKAVYVYIKATSGLAENQQDNVLNDVKEYVSPSLVYNTDNIEVYRQVSTYTFQFRGCSLTDFQTAINTVLNGKSLPHKWAFFISRRDAGNNNIFPGVIVVDTNLSVNGWYSNGSGIETEMGTTDLLWGNAIIVVVD